MISLIVMETATQSNEVSHLYQALLQKIQMIYGSDENLHPIASYYLNISFRNQDLTPEIKIRTPSKSWLSRFLYLSKLKLENLLRLLLIRSKSNILGVEWSQVKDTIIAATDYKKFDDMLRMVISGNSAQREQLIAYLEPLYTEGKLVYGLHVSDRALMTCLVFEPNGRQVHFVDGADGGYVVAAKAMKAQMQRRGMN